MALHTYCEAVSALQIADVDVKFDGVDTRTLINPVNLVNLYVQLFLMMDKWRKGEVTLSDLGGLVTRLASVQVQHVHTTCTDDGTEKMFMKYVLHQIEEGFGKIRQEMKEDNEKLREEMNKNNKRLREEVFEKIEDSSKELRKEMNDNKKELNQRIDTLSEKMDRGFKKLEVLLGGLDEIIDDTEKSLGVVDSKCDSLGDTCDNLDGTCVELRGRIDDTDLRVEKEEITSKIIHAKAYNLQYRHLNRSVTNSTCILPLKVVEGRGKGFLNKSNEHIQGRRVVSIGQRPFHVPHNSHHGVIADITSIMTEDDINNWAIDYNDTFGVNDGEPIDDMRQKLRKWINEGPMEDQEAPMFFGRLSRYNQLDESSGHSLGRSGAWRLGRRR